MGFLDRLKQLFRPSEEISEPAPAGPQRADKQIGDHSEPRGLGDEAAYTPRPDESETD